MDFAPDLPERRLHFDSFVKVVRLIENVALEHLSDFLLVYFSTESVDAILPPPEKREQLSDIAANFSQFSGKSGNAELDAHVVLLESSTLSIVFGGVWQTKDDDAGSKLYRCWCTMNSDSVEEVIGRYQLWWQIVDKYTSDKAVACHNNLVRLEKNAQLEQELSDFYDLLTGKDGV